MRTVELTVISDLHLGTRHCQALQLLNYLYSIDPSEIILLGDVFDIIQKERHYWPEEHTHIVRKILKFAATGVPITYVTGNHDALIRLYTGTAMGNITIVDRLTRSIDGRHTLFTHGDCFDLELKWPWLHALGSRSYDALIWFNRQLNRLLGAVGCQPCSITGFIKRNLAQASSYIERFEKAARRHAREQGYEAVVCGHIHQPRLSPADNNDDLTTYLNSGDWTEHCTALEFDAGAWSLHYEAQVSQPGAEGELITAA